MVPSRVFSGWFESLLLTPTFAMNITRHVFLAVLPALFLTSCVTPVVTRNNGAKIHLLAGWNMQAGQTVEWSGAKDANGFATGPGTMTWYEVDGKKGSEMETNFVAGKPHGSYLLRHYDHDKLNVETKGTYSNGVQVGASSAFYFQADTPKSFLWKKCNYDAYGRLHGQSDYKTLNGERNVCQWSNGSLISDTTYNPDGSVKQPTSYSSSSSTSDTDILGGILALGGVAGGSADLTMGGISMMAGDNAGALNHISNMNTGSGLSSAGSTAVAGGAAPKIKAVNKPNLIDSYGLAKYRSASGDHIKHYIDSADRAYSDYKQSGEENYYLRHREYADTAKQFHEQTSTQGTRMIR